MKGYLRKLMCGLMAVLMLFSLVACGDNADNLDTDGNGTNDTVVDVGTESSDSVVAVINGRNITRAEVGEELLAAEQEVISTYLYKITLDEFLGDIEITDSEVALQMEMIKAQVGEESWPMYLTYYGGGTEESFKVMLAESLRQEQYISKKMETMTVEDSELEALYNADPNTYNIAVLDVIFFSTTEELNTAKELYDEGKTLEDIAEEMSLSVHEDEHTYYYSESLTWTADFNDCEIGDYIFSKEDSGSLVIARIVELNEGLDNTKVREDLEYSVKYEKAYAETNEEYSEYIKGQSVQIMGEEYSLYKEEDSTTATGIE